MTPLVSVLAASLLSVTIALIVFAAARTGDLERGKAARLAAARGASARVLAVLGGADGADAHELVLRLMVDGRAVLARWSVLEDGLASLREGQLVPVRVDADDPSLIYPAAPWADLPPPRWTQILTAR
jgi:hypothetical protein